MELIINQHGQIKNIISEHPFLSLIGTIFIVVFMVSIMGPITPICIVAGFYFGFYQGLIISIAGETLGAIVVFLYFGIFWQQCVRYSGTNFFLAIKWEAGVS